MSEKQKRVKGKQISVTLPPYYMGILERLVERKHHSKTTIISDALYYYSTKLEKEEEGNAQK
jgi:hypothetical protein